MMLSVGFLLICLCTSAIAGNSSSTLNVTSSNVSTISTRQFPFGIDLPKSIRNKSNDTNHSIVTSHSKVKVPGLGAKHHKAVTATNTIDLSETGENATLSANLRNLTQNIKNGGNRSSSIRFFDRLASKVSLVSLTSSKVSDASNKTSSVKNERMASVNASLIELKNATDRINRTMEKRSVHNSTVTDRASSFFQTLPALLVNTTSNVKSNVTSWAKRLFGTVNDSTTNVTTKKVSRDTTTAELKSLVNTKELNTSVLNNTDNGRSTAAVISHKGEEKDSLNILSSLLNLTATLPKRDIVNLTVDIPTAKENNSSVINSTRAGIKRDSKIVKVPLKKLQSSSVKTELEVANFTEKILEKTNFSLIGSLSNRTKRHFNNVKPVFEVPSRPANSKPGFLVPSRPVNWMPTVTTPKSIPAVPSNTIVARPAALAQIYNNPAPYAPRPFCGMAPGSPVHSHGKVPAASAPVYGMTPAASALAYGMAPATSAPTYGVPPAAPASAYGVPPAAPASAYGVPPAAPASAYGVPPAAPASAYGVPPAAPASAYGVPPAASASAYGVPPAAPASAYGVPPAAPASAYGVPPAAPASAYGVPPAAPASAYGVPPASPIYATPASAAPAPDYGMASAASVPAYEISPDASTYTTSAPFPPAYEQSTESYYTAPRPSSTTNAPYNLQPTPSLYGISSPPVSYPAQPYGSVPSRPSPTGSPWY